MVAQTAVAAIPKPPGHPIIGNMLDLQGETPLLNLVELAKIYGPIFRLEVGGRQALRSPGRRSKGRRTRFQTSRGRQQG